MQGRYGVDNLSRFLSSVALVLILLTFVIRIQLLSTIGLILIAIVYFRMFSRNIQKRYRENVKFIQLRQSFTGFFTNFRRNAQQRRQYHIYKCPRCAQKIRIPRGKGKIMVRCPRCGCEFKERS